MRSRRMLGLLLFAPVACDDGTPAPRTVPSLDDYVITTPRPIGMVRGAALEGAAFRVEARALRYSRDGLRASIDRLDAVIDARGPISADLFGVVAERAAAGGGRAWRMSGDELRLRDVRMVNGEARSATLLPAQLIIDIAGRPRLHARLGARARTDVHGVLHADADLSFGQSTVALSAALAPNDRWNAVIDVGRLQLADVHPFVDEVPAHGSAHGTITASGGPGALFVSSRDLMLETDRSELRLAGGVGRAGERWAVDSVTLDFGSVHPDDWRAWLGSAPPVDAPLHGRLVADGDGRAGIDVDGWLLADDGTQRLAADVDGTLWVEPKPRVDVAVESRGLRLGATGPLDLDVRLLGGADSLAIAGAARLVHSDDVTDVHPLLAELPDHVATRFEGAQLRVDALVQRDDDGRRAAGSAELVDSAGRVWLAVAGTAPLGGSGALDVTLLADSLPLSLVPMPSRVRDIEGFARARARAGGTMAAPSLDAELELVDARFAIPEYGLRLDSLRTHARLTGERIELVDVRGFRGAGSLVVTGGVDLSAPLDPRALGAALHHAMLDVRVSLDTMTIVDIDSARAVVAGDFTVSGPLARPHIAGSAAVVDGFVFEGRLAPQPPLDPEDPPYADLLASAPWPSTRLRAVAERETARDSTPSEPPFTADLGVTVAPDFRIIDEDSDLGALGGVRLVIDDRGAFALGDARIVDGFYAYYGELFQLSGGAFAVEGTTSRLAMSGVLRNADRPLGVGQGGYDGLDRRDPPIGIFGYATPATVLELLRRRAPLPATQPELASLLLFDVPLQPIDAWDHELLWRGDEPDDLIGHRSAIQGSGLAWSYVADELYDYVPLEVGYLRAGTVRIGSRYPGWIMLGTQLDAGVHVGPRLTARATHVVGGETWPGVGLRFALREHALQPADRHLELFNEPRFATSLGTSGSTADFTVRRRTGVRARWFWDY